MSINGLRGVWKPFRMQLQWSISQYDYPHKEGDRVGEDWPGDVLKYCDILHTSGLVRFHVMRL